MAHPRSPDLETKVGLTWINRIGVVTLLVVAGIVVAIPREEGQRVRVIEVRGAWLVVEKVEKAIRQINYRGKSL